MGKNKSASGLINVINYDNFGNISFVSGSTTLMQVSSSGAITTTGVISGSSAQSASLAQNSNLLQGTGSVGFTTTGSFTTMSSSLSSRTTQIESVYATTGSNSFRATQSITGSLTVTGQIIAQSLNVQQVTSSIVYSSGSNVFGCDINSRQTFTGSFYQTGSIAAFAGSVGIGTTNPTYDITLSKSVASGNVILNLENTSTTGAVRLYFGNNSSSSGARIQYFGATHALRPNLFSIGTDVSNDMMFETGGTERVRITAGGLLQINGTSNNAIITTDSSANVIGLFATSSVIDNTPRIEVTGTTFAGTPSTAFIRANTVRFTLNSASTETMRITCVGNVGIGTGTPDAKLHICNSISGGTNNYLIIVQNCCTVADSRAGIAFSNNSQTPSAGGLSGASIQTSNNGIDGAGNLLFSTLISGASCERMRITSAGVVTKPFQPFVMGGIASDQTISTSNPTKINFVTNTGHFGCNVGGHWNNSTYQLTAPATGVYLVNISGYWSSINMINQFAAFVNSNRKVSIPTGYCTNIAGGSMMVPMTAGETMDFRVYNDVGTGTLYSNVFHTFFSIYLL